MFTRFIVDIRWIFICITLLACANTATAHCPDGPSFRRKLDTILKTSDNSKIINQLLPLIKHARTCNLRDSSMAQMLHVLGRTFWYEGKLDSAILITRQAIALNASGGSAVQPANLCHSYYNLASIYLQKGDLIRSQMAIQHAIYASQKHQAKKGSMADSFCLMANIYSSSGDYEKAVVASDIANRLAFEANRLDLVAKSQFEKAQALIELDSLKQTELVLNIALATSQETKQTQFLGGIYSLIADLKSKQNQPKAVITFYLLSFRAFAKSGFNYGCGQAAESLGYYYAKKLSLPDKALYQYKLALKYANTDALRALLYSHISEIYCLQKNYLKAIQLAQQALSVAGLNVDENNLTQNPSAKILRTKLDKTAMLMLLEGKATTWLEAAKANSNNIKQLATALETFTLADTLVDYMRWEHTGKASKLFWREKTRPIYESAIETCLLLNNPEKALYFFEKSRAVLLNDQLNESGAATKLSRADIEKEAKLKTEVRVLQTALTDGPANEQDDTRKKLFATQETLERFIKTLEKTNPQYYAYKFGTNVPTLAEIRNKILAKDQIFISYFLGQNAAYGLVISHQHIQLKKLDHKTYSSTFPRFQQLLSTKEAQNQNFKEYLEHANIIFKTLFQPLSVEKSTRVVISPDGNFIPFEALSASPSSPKYLVNDYAFSYTYSAGYLLKARREKGNGLHIKDFLGMAPVHFTKSSGQPDLPASDDALARIASPFLLPTLLTQTKATRLAYEQSAAKYQIVQLLTHAEADSAKVTPRIYFSDYSLSLDELPERGNSKTQLLVLSACRTGIGKHRQGEGVFSLARGFAGLGIPSILTTLWNVENESIYDLTEQFYRGVSKDEPLDIALQKAKKHQLLTGSKSAQLPCSWAGMVLIGNTAPLPTGLSLPAWLWLTCGFLTLCILSIWGRKVIFPKW